MSTPSSKEAEPEERAEEADAPALVVLGDGSAPACTDGSCPL